MIIAIVAILSVLGIFGMTFLFPLLAAIISPSTKRAAVSSPHPRNVAILIPAHNEETVIQKTLESIAEAIKVATDTSPCAFRVLVGADGCTDTTAATATKMGAEVLTMPRKTGKWSTISTLVASCQESQWIVLADCGAAWPKDFLARLLPLLTREETMGIAPTYLNDASGLVERLVWRTERAIKMIESKCGGPVSVHGATVCYRTKELTSTLQFLSNHHWLNDDIVIPLCLRALYPAKNLEYATHLTVNDSAAIKSPASREFVRRRRLVLGNIQWIRHLWVPIWRQNYVADILASRRVFRLLWGYWAISTASTFALYIEVFNLPKPQLLALALLITALFSCVKQLRTLLESGLASILAPYYLLVAILRSSTSPYVTQWN